MSEEINNLKGIFANVNDDMLLRDCGNLYAENKQLQQENQQLKERIEYLERSNNRREDTIISLRDELNETKSPTIFIDTQDMEERYGEGLYMDYLEEQNKLYKSVLDEIRECIDNFPCIHYASAEKVDGKRLSGKLIPVDDLLQILDKVRE